MHTYVRDELNTYRQDFRGGGSLSVKSGNEIEKPDNAELGSCGGHSIVFDGYANWSRFSLICKKFEISKLKKVIWLERMSFGERHFKVSGNILKFLEFFRKFLGTFEHAWEHKEK